MTTWTLIRENDGEYSIGKNRFFYTDLSIASVDQTIHAMQWNGTSGDIERRDTSTGSITTNETIANLDDFSFMTSAWDTARQAHKTEWTADYIDRETETDEEGVVTAPTQAEADTAFEAKFPVSSD